MGMGQKEAVSGKRGRGRAQGRLGRKALREAKEEGKRLKPGRVSQPGPNQVRKGERSSKWKERRKEGRSESGHRSRKAPRKKASLSPRRSQRPSKGDPP